MRFKSNKLFIMVMTFLLAATTFFSVPVKTSAEVGPQVQLISSKVISKNDHVVTVGYIKTALSGSAGAVTIHYQIGDGTWQDTNANYLGVKDNSYNLWYFEIDGGANPLTYNGMIVTTNFRFAIKYSVNGQDYWDNNNNNDYKVGSGYTDGYGRAVLSAANVSLYTAQANYGYRGVQYFNGEIYLKNLAYAKDVKVVYTTNDWATQSVIPATYNSTELNGLEDWSFVTSLSSGVTQIKFAISYTVNGTTYWDNNFENNYTLNVGSSVQ